MKKSLTNLINKKLTKNHTEVPLLWVNFNLKKYQEQGNKGSCDLMLHPSLKGDDWIKHRMNELVDYIRDTYDMKDLV